MAKSSGSRWQFVFSAMQGIAALGAILIYFGIIPTHPTIHMTLNSLPSVWWLVGAIFLFASSIGFSAYGLYRNSNKQPAPIPELVISQEPNAADSRSELLALRRLIGELNEEVGGYAPNRDLGSLRERLSKVERAAGTFGHNATLRQAIRDVWHTLAWIVFVKSNPERAPEGTNLREQLETQYQHFLSEINRLL